MCQTQGHSKQLKEPWLPPPGRFRWGLTSVNTAWLAFLGVSEGTPVLMNMSPTPEHAILLSCVPAGVALCPSILYLCPSKAPPLPPYLTSEGQPPRGSPLRGQELEAGPSSCTGRPVCQVPRGRLRGMSGASSLRGLVGVSHGKPGSFRLRY